MKTYTFAGGNISPGFVLTTDERGTYLALGKYAPQSWLTRVPLNVNLDNRPKVNGSVVCDAFVLNIGDNRGDYFILCKDRSQGNGCCLMRFVTQGRNDETDGYVCRTTGTRSWEIVAGHGRNKNVSRKGIWTDSVWVLAYGETLKVQLAGCDTVYVVRIGRDGIPTAEPWVDSQPRQPQQPQPAKQLEAKPEPVAVATLILPTPSASGNGNNGRNGENPHQWRKLAGSHVVADNAAAELAEAGRRQTAKFNARYYRRQSAAA